MKKHDAPKTKRFHVRGKDREYFTSNLALLLRANVPIGQAFEALKQTSKARAMRDALTQMQRDIDEGQSLWRVLNSSGITSQQTLALIQLGEQSGHLAENLLVAARQEEKQRILRSKVRSALMYPVFVLGLTAIIGIGVAWFLLPRLAETFTQLDIDLPLISQIFINFGTFLQHNGIWAVPGGIGATLLLGYIIFVAPKTRQIGQRILFILPGVSGMLREIEIARFGYMLGTLLQAGLSVTDALELLYNATATGQYNKLYRHVRDSFEEGYSFRASLASYRHSTKLLPPSVQQIIIAGEQSGALPETLQSIGTIYEEKANTSTENLEAILEPILLVIVWLGVMGVAVAVILPIYSLIGGLDT